MKTISPNELGKLLNQAPSSRLIDVRTPAEFGEVHVENAINIPLDTLNAKDEAVSQTVTEGLRFTSYANPVHEVKRRAGS